MASRAMSLSMVNLLTSDEELLCFVVKVRRHRRAGKLRLRLFDAAAEPRLRGLCRVLAPLIQWLARGNGHNVFCGGRVLHPRCGDERLQPHTSMGIRGRREEKRGMIRQPVEVIANDAHR